MGGLDYIIDFNVEVVLVLFLLAGESEAQLESGG